MRSGGARGSTARCCVRGSLRETPSRIAQGNAEHGALLEAMRRRDGDAVERILFEHLEHTLGALKEP